VAISPHANYTAWSTTAAGKACADFCWVEGVAWSVQRVFAAVNLSFLDRTYKVVVLTITEVYSLDYMSVKMFEPEEMLMSS
jgi:hypothetical protein